MNYTVSDLIEKLIGIEKNSLDIYSEIEEMSKDNESKAINIFARAIKQEELKHKDYYENLKKELNKEELNEEIDFFLYDKVAKILYEFKNQIRIPQIYNVQDLLKYALDFEKNNIWILLDIKGRLLGSLKDVNNNVYKVLSKIISEEKEHEKMFSQLIIK